MTTAAVIFGMFPVALALSEGGETRAPMAVCVIGGLITSTLTHLGGGPRGSTSLTLQLNSRLIRWFGQKLFGGVATTEAHGTAE